MTDKTDKTDKTENPMDAVETQGEEMRTTEEIIGRADVNDLEAILSFIGREDESGHHNVVDNCEAEFTWDYDKGRLEKLDRLYEKAKTAQWNARTDLACDTPVDPEAPPRPGGVAVAWQPSSWCNRTGMSPAGESRLSYRLTASTGRPAMSREPASGNRMRPSRPTARDMLWVMPPHMSMVSVSPAPTM